MEPAKKVLVFNVENDKFLKIQEICDGLGLSGEYIAKERYGENLGMLAGLDEYTVQIENYTGKELAGEMMVFFNLESEELDGFLKAYNSSGLERINLKAVVTPHNVTWKPCELFEELRMEHEEMAGRNNR